MPSSNTSRNHDMQDALEAYQTFRSARSACFWIILVSLLVLQTIFWVVNKGKIDAILNFDQEQSNSVFVHNTPHPSNIFVQQMAEESPEPDSNQQPNAKRQYEITKTLSNFIQGSLRFFNTLICFAALVYCLSLLIGMKLALVGHLGGLAESGKAFFLSLVVLALILPWQPIIAGETPGTLFSYHELTHSYIESTTYITLLSLDAIAYYVRFVGFWGLTLSLLFAVQWRSCRAARQIIRRCQTNNTTHQPTVINNSSPMNQSNNDTLPLE